MHRLTRLIAITALLPFLACSADNKDPVETFSCAQNMVYHLILIEKGQCFAEEYPLYECIRLADAPFTGTTDLCKESPEGLRYVELINAQVAPDTGWAPCGDQKFWNTMQSEYSLFEENDCLIRSPEGSWDWPHWECLESAWLLTQDASSCTAQDYPLDDCVIYSPDSANNLITSSCLATEDGTLLFYDAQWHPVVSPDWQNCGICVSEHEGDGCCLIVP